MEILGLELAQTDWSGLWVAVRDYALPRLAISAGFLLLAAVLHRIARWLVGRLEKHLVGWTKTAVDNAIVRAAGRALVFSVWFWAFWRIAHLWELESLARGVVAVWIVGLSIPLAGLVSDLLEVAERRLGRTRDTPLDQTALPLVNKIVRFLVVILGVLVALESVGVNVTPLLAGAGVAGLAISLAAKDTLSNLIAGILLIMDRPFQVGDRIELWSAPGETGSWGDVVEIGLRATKIRNPDNLVVVIPNNEIMRRDIVNYTASGNHIRLRLPFAISYDSNTKLAKEIVLECARKVEGVKLDPEPAVIVRRFGDSSVDLELRVWIDDARERRAIGDEVTERVKEAFDARGVEIPYPKRDIYIRGGDDPAPARPAGEPGSDPGSGR